MVIVYTLCTNIKIKYIILLCLCIVGDYAFIAEKSWYQAEVAKDCSLAMMKETFYPTNYGWAFQPNAPIISILNDR